MPSCATGIFLQSRKAQLRASLTRPFAILKQRGRKDRPDTVVGLHSGAAAFQLNVTDLCNRILFDHKKEWSTELCYNTAERRKR